MGVVFMANKYIVLDWQEVVYDEYMVFRKGAPAVRRQPKGQYTRQFSASLPI